MTDDINSKFSIQSVIAMVIIAAVVCLTVIAIKPGIFPTFSKQTPTTIQLDSSPDSLYQPEIIPLPSHTPGPPRTVTVAPTNTPFPTRTPFILPTLVFDSQPLPDLTVTGISDPVCATEYEGTKIRFAIFIKNIGRARTRYFGPFDTDVYLILGQRRYSLAEWEEQFSGVIGSSIAEVANLNPGQDIKFTVVIDIRGNKNFYIEVITNSGENPIREADTTNNTLIKYFSVACY